MVPITSVVLWWFSGCVDVSSDPGSKPPRFALTHLQFSVVPEEIMRAVLTVKHFGSRRAVATARRILWTRLQETCSGGSDSGLRLAFTLSQACHSLTPVREFLMEAEALDVLGHLAALGKLKVRFTSEFVKQEVVAKGVISFKVRNLDLFRVFRYFEDRIGSIELKFVGDEVHVGPRQCHDRVGR
jgi:hypothetical protein